MRTGDGLTHDIPLEVWAFRLAAGAQRHVRPVRPCLPKYSEPANRFPGGGLSETLSRDDAYARRRRRISAKPTSPKPTSAYVPGSGIGCDPRISARKPV